LIADKQEAKVRPLLLAARRPRERIAGGPEVSSMKRLLSVITSVALVAGAGLLVGNPVRAEAPQASDHNASEPLDAVTPAPETPAPETTEAAVPSPEATLAPEAAASGQPTWHVETPPVQGSGDVADDPAIWVNETDPAQSLVIGANKDDSTGGLHVYDLGGQELQYLPTGKMNNVDVRYGYELGGSAIDLVAATNRTDDTIDFFAVEPGTGLREVGSVPSDLAVYGSCMYMSASGAFYAFANSEQGEVEQFEITAEGDSVTGTNVRTFDVGGGTEGCVADDETGALYIGEEQGGIWRYGADPDAGDARVQVDDTSSGHLTPDVEGLALFQSDAGAGYLVASSQGDSTFAVYDRAGDNAYLGSFSIGGANGDAVTETDGIDATSVPLGSDFPGGLLVVHDASNEGTSNFKYVAWDQVIAALGVAEPIVPVEPLPEPTLPDERLTPTPPPLPAPEGVPGELGAMPPGDADVSTKVMICDGLGDACNVEPGPERL
jgi:3-phytase